MNEKEYGINVDHNDIRNPGFSIASKAMEQAVKLGLQFRENIIISQCTCFLHKIIK
jgi:hypothetical protein